SAWHSKRDKFSARQSAGVPATKPGAGAAGSSHDSARTRVPAEQLPHIQPSQQSRAYHPPKQSRNFRRNVEWRQKVPLNSRQPERQSLELLVAFQEPELKQ